MSKQLKSIRFDDDLLDLFTEFSALMTELFGDSLSFSGIVNEAVAAYLDDVISRYAQLMEAGAIVEHLPNGKIREYAFGEGQIAHMKKLSQDASALSIMYQERS